MPVRDAGAAWLIAISLAAGCASARTPRPGLPLPPSEAERSAFGPVAVVVAPAPPRSTDGLPSGGWREGVGTGLDRGAIVVGGVAEASPFAGGALAIIVMPAFAVAGAISAPSREETGRATSVIVPVLEDAAAGEALAARFVEAAEADAGVRCVAAGDASTVVELCVARIEMRPRPGGPPGADDLVAFVTCRARVVHRSDGRVVYDGEITSGNPGAGRTLVAWAADGGRGLRDVIAAACARAAPALAEEIFLVDRTLAAPRDVRP